jgi:monoamine oxidase
LIYLNVFIKIPSCARRGKTGAPRGEGVPVERKAEVIVIGAGLAGLRAANDLVAQGRSVILLEAKDRVGGRLMPGEVGGRIVDFGGQWVGARHSMLLDEARRHGIETYKQYETGKTVLELFGKLSQFSGNIPKIPLLSLLEFFLLQKRWDREMKTVPKDAPWAAPRAAEWDAMTLDSWIARHVRTAAARQFARLVPRGAWAVEAREISYLWFLDALRSGDGLEHLMAVKDGILDAKFKGGMHGVARAMAADLGERVVLSAPVRMIVQDQTGVRVTTDKGDFEARFLIVAAPPGPLARIDFEPHLPAARDGLHQRMSMGNIIKINIAYKEAFWRKLGFSGQVATDDDTLGIVMDDVQETGPAMLICFIEGRRALEMSGMSKEDRRARTIASLVRFFGPEAAHPVDYDDNDWSVEPFTHGYVGTMPPGVMTRYGHALREPVGRIHWAGTETSTEWAGYIEGALRSGARAASEILQRHNS